MISTTLIHEEGIHNMVMPRNMQKLFTEQLLKMNHIIYVGQVTVLNPTFLNLTIEQQLKTVLCQTTTKLAKYFSKFLGIISDTRNEIDLGLQISHVQQNIAHKSPHNS